MENITKQELMQSLEDCIYKKEISKNIVTVFYHKGNGWNYRVEYMFLSNKTKITKYYTNSFVNQDHHSIVFKGIFKIKDHENAESDFHTRTPLK
jgi:ribosomal protein S12